MFDVVCLGNLVADLVGRPIDSLPAKGTQGLVERMELHTGGCAANTGVALTKLGARTAVAGKVGRDGLGEFVVNRLRDSGCDIGGISRDELVPTSSTMVLVHSDGERSFLHCFGANATLNLDDINLERLFKTSILHIAGALTLNALDSEPTAKILKEAKSRGIVTSLDVVWDAQGEWLPKIECCLPFVDYFLPNLSEAKMLAVGCEDADSAARFFLEKGVGTVCIKMGDRGSLAMTHGANGDVKTIVTPAYSVEAIDGLGAGDSFNAGFFVGLLKGWTLEKSLEFASAVGACCVSSLGATTGVRSFDETLEFMTNHSLRKSQLG